MCVGLLGNEFNATHTIYLLWGHKFPPTGVVRYVITYRMAPPPDPEDLGLRPVEIYPIMCPVQ